MSEEVSKDSIVNIYKFINEELGNPDVAEMLNVVGHVVGLIALQLERENNIDRNQSFKMIQRNGHSAVNMLTGKVVQEVAH